MERVTHPRHRPRPVPTCKSIRRRSSTLSARDSWGPVNASLIQKCRKGDYHQQSSNREPDSERTSSLEPRRGKVTGANSDSQITSASRRKPCPWPALRR